MNEQEEKLRKRLELIGGRLAAVRLQSEAHLRRLDDIEIRDLAFWVSEKARLDGMESALVLIRNRTQSRLEQALGLYVFLPPESLVVDREVVR